MRIPLIGMNGDERCLDHHRRSTSLAAMAGTFTGIGIWEYDWFAHHYCNWQLASVLIVIVVTKLAASAWYRFTY
ncbi:MAG TPA: hypothetical protein VME18_13775 [Acidobacteriaceae bacterium]|nr:hypothetical protein [Acidobacteriaceae bacterium]